MGVAIADEAASRGAKVILVLGPVDLKPERRNYEIINVISAHEMADAMTGNFGEADVSVLAAAVADYRPESESASKIKKSNSDLSLTLKPTNDIAAMLGSVKRNNQLLAGFALETDNEKENALKKLESKNLDLIVLNSLRDEGSGFKSDTNKISLIDKNNNIEEFELKTKAEVAADIMDKIESML